MRQTAFSLRFRGCFATTLLQCSSGKGFVAVATITKISGKKGDSYRVQIRKFAKGKIIYSEAKTLPTLQLAKRWAAKREEQLLEPGAIERSKGSGIKVVDLIDRYIHDFCQNVGRTKNADVRALKGYEFSELPIDKLTSDVLIAHVAFRLRTVQPQTVNNELVWLRNVYKAAYPAWGIKVDSHEIDAAASLCRAKGMVSSSTERDRRPTAKELKLLDAHFASRDGRASIPMQDIMWFALHSSRRQEEITKLLWADNNEKHLTGLVRDIKHPRKKGLNKKFKYTKEAWKIVQRQPKTSERIFPYNPRSIGAAFTRACHLLNIKDLHFHDLRREATSRLFEAGYSIPQVQLFTLHESWTVLSRYSNLRPEDLN